MNEKALKEKIKLLEHVIELQKQLLAVKGMSYPVYVPYIQQPLYDPWRPWKPYYYEPSYATGTVMNDPNVQYTPTITSTTLRGGNHANH